MTAKSVRRVSEWKALLAAMLYFATFLAVGYGVYAAARGAAFLDAVALAYPRAFAACVLLFVCSAAFEILRTALKKSRAEAQRTTVRCYRSEEQT